MNTKAKKMPRATTLLSLIIIVNLLISGPLFYYFYMFSNAEFASIPINNAQIVKYFLFSFVCFFVLHTILAVKPKSERLITYALILLLGFSSFNTYLTGAYIYHYHQEYQNLVEEIDAPTLQNLIKNQNQNTTLHFFVTKKDCPDCQTFMPEVLKYAKTYFFKLYLIDATNMPKNALKELSITHYPTLVIFEDGKKTLYQTPQNIKDILDKHGIF